MTYRDVVEFTANFIVFVVFAVFATLFAAFGVLVALSFMAWEVISPSLPATLFLVRATITVGVVTGLMLAIKAYNKGWGCVLDDAWGGPK